MGKLGLVIWNLILTAVILIGSVMVYPVIQEEGRAAATAQRLTEMEQVIKEQRRVLDEYRNILNAQITTAETNQVKMLQLEQQISYAGDVINQFLKTLNDHSNSINGLIQVVQQLAAR